MSSFLKSSKSISARLASIVIGSCDVSQLYSMLPPQSSPGCHEDEDENNNFPSESCHMIEYDDNVIVIVMMTVSSANDGDLHLGLGQRWLCPRWTAVGRSCQGDPMD